MTLHALVTVVAELEACRPSRHSYFIHIDPETVVVLKLECLLIYLVAHAVTS